MSSGGSILTIIGNTLGQLLRGLLGRKSTGATPETKSTVRTAPKPKAQVKPKAKSTAKPKAPQASIKPESPRSSTRGGDVLAAHREELQARERLLEGEPSPGQLGASATLEIAPPAAGDVFIAYAPDKDGAPDAGEIVWTWIPYDEADGRGKDRPVLVIANQGAGRVLVVRLTSKSHDGERDFLSIGSGSWDSQGRESWVDIDQVYSVHEHGMRREAATLDRQRFSQVAGVLQARYGWRTKG